MELKHFRLIKTIAEEGSIANSSEKLFLTQSALSHQLRELENQLGFKVFFRKRNKWTLSEQGNELYKLSIELLDKIDERFAAIDKINLGSQGKIRVGTECYLLYQRLPTFIQSMGILYPDIEVNIVVDAAHNPIPKLISKDIDIAITTERINDENLKSIELFKDEVVCIMNKEHPFHSKEFLEASCFADVHLFIHSYPLESVSIYSRLLKPNNVNPKKVTAIPFLSLTFEMIAANMGVITLPIHTLDAFKLSDQIIFKKIGKNGLKRIQYLVYRREDESKQYINDFITNFRDEFIT